MATNLVQLHVTSSGNTPFSADEIREIKSHGGQFLPLTKETNESGPTKCYGWISGT
ncbi:hypothetical protein JG688_00013969 [Phytophthora aleatoria]|uniref:Uncharacterized protein n=1 Tax=Phytophthora aleatoria TaxID=2496075 RepID=A0A8J5IGN0_9STRA|nr:hypothetical protein JG688_00013969 [Phytophthora aleatoria]